jgi:hypothetical protein
VKASGARTRIEIGIDPAWIDRHPLSEYLFAEEARMWERVGASLTLNGRALADGRFGVGA